MPSTPNVIHGLFVYTTFTVNDFTSVIYYKTLVKSESILIDCRAVVEAKSKRLAVYIPGIGDQEKQAG